MKKRPNRKKPQARATRKQRATAALVVGALSWSCFANAADLNTEMTKMFADIGAMGTASGPSAFRGQTMNLYSGGEMHMRTPIRTYQLFSATLPSIRAGCGGIDAYMGSFSYINGDQWKALIKNLGGPIAGLLIQSALKSINPLIASTIEDLQKVIQWANQANINSCEAAKQLVNGLSNMMSEDTYASCMDSAEYYGMDRARARAECRENARGMNEGVRTSGDANFNKAPPRNVNLMWHALSGTSFTREERETFINIAGSFVVRGIVEGANNAPVAPVRYTAMLESNFDLVFGTDAATAPETIRVQWWECTDGDCLVMRQTTRNLTSFRKVVVDLLSGIRSKMETGSGTLSPGELDFINNTTIPVWKMLNVGYSDPSGTVSNYVVERYSTVIALDYAHTFMRRALKEASFYLDRADWRGSGEEQMVKEIRDTIRDRMTRLERERQAAHERVGNLHQIIAEMQQIERSLYANMSTRMKANMEWAGAMKTQWRF